MTEFCYLAEKGHVFKESGVMTQGKKEVEVDTLWLGDDKTNVINKIIKY